MTPRIGLWPKSVARRMKMELNSLIHSDMLRRRARSLVRILLYDRSLLIAPIYFN